MPGFVDIWGIALATNPVYVNGELAYRQGEYFRRELSFNIMSAPVWEQVRVTASGETPVTGNVFVPRTPESFTHDLDGNMTSDGRWNYTWDAENRLTRVESRFDTPQASWRRVEWTFDAFGRRIRQTTWMWNTDSGTWQVTEDLKFISDPMLFGRHSVELNGTNNSLVRTYVWGLDLSGTMDGAGGVGGLLWVSNFQSPIGHHFAAYDGNGNVVALVSATTGAETARYEYGPFAEPIRVTGPAANQNPFRFSSKRTCNSTDLVLYEYRTYNPVLGRWLSKDYIGELGGINLCGFLLNDPVSYVDKFGMHCLSCNAVSTEVPEAHTGGSDTAHGCKSTLTFTIAGPKMIGNEAKIKRLCSGAAGCSGPDRMPKIKCKRCSACSWKMVVEGKVTCLIYLADPKKVNVQYFPNGLESAIKHEQCHCADWRLAFQKLIEEAAAGEYRSKAQCEQAKKAFDVVKRIDELMSDSRDHKLPKYQPGGECYAYSTW